MSANNKQHGGLDDYQITLTRGHVCFVDADVFETIGHLKWSAVTPNKNLIYAVRYDAGKFVYLHRLIMDAQKGDIVDHIDGDTLNNTRSNLRFVSKSQNSINKQGGYGVSEYRGVWFRPDRKKQWCAEIRVNRCKKYLGSFYSEKEAADAYDAALMIYFPQHGKPNNAK